MIQIYSPDNRDYTKNGDMTLFPTEATPRAELNGSWSATLTHPIDKDGRWKYIVEDAVVKMPSFNGDQLFRIISKKKSDSGVEAQMEPIFYDAISDCWLTDIRPTGKNGQEALDLMLASNAKYSARSDITKASTAYYQYVNFFEALNGDIDQSFIKRWGGEILYDNFTVIVNERVGGDYGVELRYGKNIPENGLSEEIDLSGVVTRIYPKAYNGYTITGNGYVDSPLINHYPITHIATITFDDVKMREDAQEDDEENGVIICDTQEELNAALREKCQEQYDAGLDKPTVTISADMILLQNTEQYKEYKILETVSLGDTIHCKNSKLGIVTDARVISLEYDSLRKKVTAVTLGDFAYNYFDNVTSSVDRIDQAIRPDGTVMADKVAGILNGIYTQLRLQSTAAQKVDGVAFKVEDLDPDSPLYGCMIWGTQGLQISVTRTADGKDWDWTTALTAKGMIGEILVAGIISDKLGKNFWNLDTGEFRLSAEAFKVDDQTLQEYVDGTIDKKIETIKTLTLQLSNDFQGVATDADGNNGDYSQCYTIASLYIGTSDITDAATYAATSSTGVTGQWDNASKKYTVINMTVDTGSVTIKAIYSNLIAEKVFSVAKVRQGGQGIPGEPGKDGSTKYTWLKYADTPTSGMSESPDGKKYMGLAINKDTLVESTDYNDYTWSLIQGQGIPGEPGKDGETLYTWVKYADNAQGSGISNSPDGKKYIGFAYNKNTPTESSNPVDYTWSLIQGEDGWSYFINLSATVVSYTDEIFVPAGVTANAYYRKGNDQMQAYTGIFKIYDSTDGNSYTLRNTTGVASTVTYTFTEKNVKSVRFEFYQPDGTTILDRQTVSVIQDSGNGNLLKDTKNFTVDYWTVSGQITRNLEAPDGSLTMASLKATNTDSYLSSNKDSNKPISAPGGYTFSVWLRADREITIQISLNHVDGIRQEVLVGTGWKQYNLSYNVETITQYNQVTIGGWGSFTSDSGATLYIWDPVVKRTLSSEEVFNMLTNDGKYQGIYMQDGQLYINGEYVRVNDLVSLRATIGGWKINNTNLKSPSGNLILDSSSGVIYTMRQNGNKGVVLQSDGLTMYGWALNGDFVGTIATGYFSDTQVQAMTIYSDYGDLLIFGMQTASKDKTNIQLALSDREINGYKIGTNVIHDLHVFGDIYVRSKIYIGGSNQNPYFQLNSDGGVYLKTSTINIAGEVYGEVVHSMGRRTATCNNQIYFQWEAGERKIAVFIDTTFIGYLSL